MSRTQTTTLFTRAAARASRRFDLPDLIAIGFLGLVAILVAFGPLIAPYDPDLPDLMSLEAPPSLAHLLGTDSLGRDLLSRLIVGARPALLAPLLIAVVATALGTLVAVFSAWCGGVIDVMISRVLDILFAVPGIIFALVAVALVGPGQLGVVIGLTISYIPYVARVIRGAAIRERNLPYIEAAWIQGQRSTGIVLGQMLPNLRNLVSSQAVANFGLIIVDVASVSFLGLGVQSPQADWGVMVRTGLESLTKGSPWEALAAGLMIAGVVAAVLRLGARFNAQERGVQL